MSGRMKRRTDGAGCRRWRILCCLILAASLALCFAGCADGNKDAVSSGNDDESTKPVIGIVFDSFVIERWERDRDVFVSMARELGADVLVGNANGEIEEQKKIISSMIDRKVNVLVIIAVDCSALSEEVDRAHRAGIRVISYDRLIQNADSDLYITFDNEAVGRFMAETINEALPEGGTYMKVNGSPRDNNVIIVNQGFDETIRSDLKMVDSISCDNWNDGETFDYLTEHPEDIQDAEAFMCGNDAIAGQVVRALAERRMAGKSIVTGQDADLDACQRVVEGTQSMTVYKPIEELAGKAARYAYSMAEGDIPETFETISDGTYEVPYIRLAPIRVTKQNMDSTVIANGFHMEDDVYLHVSHENADSGS